MKPPLTRDQQIRFMQEAPERHKEKVRRLKKLMNEEAAAARKPFSTGPHPRVVSLRATRPTTPGTGEGE